MTTPAARARVVDEIGQLKAELAPQMAALKELETLLKSFGDGRYHGAQYEATVSTHERRSLDMDAVRDHLSAQFMRAHTTVTESTVLRITARQMNDESLREAA